MAKLSMAAAIESVGIASGAFRHMSERDQQALHIELMSTVTIDDIL